jgi:hypothetical protein
MSRIYLNIPYENKDELKKTYSIKWDTDKKLWYCEKEKFEDGLKPYELVYVSIDYDLKDEYKKKIKSMQWDKDAKEWRITRKEYDEIYLKL